MSRIISLASAAVLAVMLFPAAPEAHPGGTASDGCHYCRTNCAKWGVEKDKRHCHGSKSESKAKAKSGSADGKSSDATDSKETE